MVSISFSLICQQISWHRKHLLSGLQTRRMMRRPRRYRDVRASRMRRDRDVRLTVLRRDRDIQKTSPDRLETETFETETTTLLVIVLHCHQRMCALNRKVKQETEILG